MLDEYPDADKADRLTLWDLKKIVVKQRKKDTDTITDFFNYHRKFCFIAILLLVNKALSLFNRDRYFCEGLHKDAKCSILHCIENTIKDYDHSKPIEMDNVVLAAKYILLDNTFERNCNNPVAIWLKSLTKGDNSSSDEDIGRRKSRRKRKK